MNDAGASLGSRIGTLVVAFLIGALYGTLGTVGHRQAWTIGDVTLPWGLVAALVGVAALLVAFRIFSGRLVASVVGLGVIIMVGILTLAGPGGSVLVVGDLTGTVWSIGPALVTVFVVAWPNLPARTGTAVAA
ncbi:histidinol dehydrogenase [Agromyces salentinus]|uniref:Histidinol dehydrogenase n=1 Tax=Agromyces salentinus TaxID=269421 RepID=A0ABN2MQM4_9MICO|nr:histidinol dehydrogenase [Agromyces salentinus]